jgi:hypothetical protein
VRVANASGGGYRAVIDQTGIRIEDPTLNPNIQQGLNQALEASLGKIGVQISGVERSRIVDGELADAAATALVLNFNAACEACIAVPPIPVDPRDSVPEEASDPYRQVTCAAQNVNSALPCLTVQLIPAPTSVFRGTITLGGARAVAAATPVVSFDGPAPPPLGDFGGGAFSPPSGPTGPAPGLQPEFNPKQIAPPGGTNAPPAVNGRPVALRAEMPDWGLTVAGAALLAFALLLVLGPSLRRGTPG